MVIDEIEFIFDQDKMGNLWFANSHKKGIDIYTFDGKTGTKFEVTVDKLKNADDIESLLYSCFHFISNNKGDVYISKWYRSFDPTNWEKALITCKIDKDNKQVQWSDPPGTNLLYVDGKECTFKTDKNKEREGKTLKCEVIDIADDKTLYQFKSKIVYGEKPIITDDYIIMHDSYNLEIHTTRGKFIYNLDPDHFIDEVVDIDTATWIEKNSLLICLSKRHGGGSYIYLFNLNDFSFKPHALNGKLKSKADQCYFDKLGRLWICHWKVSKGAKFTIIDKNQTVTMIDNVNFLNKKYKLPREIQEEAKRKKFGSIKAADIATIIRPAIGFTFKKSKKIPLGSSKFGGTPDLSKKLKWPGYDDCAMPFVAQINLSETKPFDIVNLLPKKGMLYFFSDTCPDDIFFSKVLFEPNPVKLESTELPETLKEREGKTNFWAMLPEYSLEFFIQMTLPHYKCKDNLGLDDDDFFLLEEIVAPYNKPNENGLSYLLGWPFEDIDYNHGDPNFSLLQLYGGLNKEIFINWCGSIGLIIFPIKGNALLQKEFSSDAFMKL